MYCPQCGTRIEDDYRFCPECGVKIQRDMAENAGNASESVTTENNYAPESANQEQSLSVMARGLILTNLQTLSNRLKTDKKIIQSIIDKYIAELKSLGLSYKLIDASDYTYSRSSFGIHKHVSLNSYSPWYDYADLLLDQHENEHSQGLPESEYVFIIGGNRDVPMPTLLNFNSAKYSKNEPDYTMDTDLLYSYPFGQKMEQELLSQKIFYYDALFYVGRLPIADDATIADLTNYLDRNTNLKCTIPFGRAYTQCASSWKNVTNAITNPLLKHGLYYDLSGIIDESKLFDKHILISPPVAVARENMLHEEFDTEAGYIFFNMHGASQKHLPFYFGDEGYIGFSPALMSYCERPNIVFTQACYGGKFIGLPKNSSMMLTSLSTKTMSFVGSSRIAWGAVDGGRLSASDILAMSFNTHAIEGESVGAAFFTARMDTFKSNPGHPTTALTICEFNLYGDPMLHIGVENPIFQISKSAPLKQGDKLNIPKEEILMNKSAGAQSMSMLSQLRHAVDSNIMKIHEIISKQLYEQYNIQAREPLIITRRTYPDGTKELAYDYQLANVTEGVNSIASVTTNESGEISSVITSK